MVALGVAVGDGSTPVDDWFQRARGSALGALLFFTDLRTVALVLLCAVVVALAGRRWVLAIVMMVSPVAAVMIARGLKLLFGRQKEGALAYPSGHTTLMVVVLGMVVLVLAARWWVVAGVAVWALLGVLGQAVSYHYFTDAVGAVLLGTSVVCIAAVIVHRAQHPSFTPASP
ncbi:PA-phosphatase [Mycobacterium sp. NBC_00419]|uniref:PA-phosphatase n=1 Tax=Mycobacterium sp. NBC_00419 TaxID=2975989 RepID=UPI002E1E030B